MFLYNVVHVHLILQWKIRAVFFFIIVGNVQMYIKFVRNTSTNKSNSCWVSVGELKYTTVNILEMPALSHPCVLKYVHKYASPPPSPLNPSTRIFHINLIDAFSYWHSLLQFVWFSVLLRYYADISVTILRYVNDQYFGYFWKTTFIIHLIVYM